MGRALLDKLLEQIPEDTEKRVERTRDRLNQHIREALRQETGLRFRRAVEETAGDVVNVRINVRPGLPEALRPRELKPEERLAAFLAPWRHTLKNLRAFSRDASQMVAQLREDPETAKLVDRGDFLSEAGDFADRLLQLADGFNCARWILEIDKDVLGTYNYSVPNANRFLPAREFAYIDLYWAVIGLMARVLGGSVEDLTAVVLAHELAHAYTHRGYDIDGDSWSSVDFAKSDHALKEGLAQYYTSQVCERIERQAPAARNAYAALLEHQPDAYQTHLPWLEVKRPEEIRLAMLQTRRNGPGRLSDFVHFLTDASQNLRPRQVDPER
jgi:hypothetical protein